MAKEQKNFQFKAEMKQLLNLIIHSLYKNPEIFLRELVSNSSDALNKFRFRRLTDTNIKDPEVDLAIKISVDKETKQFSIEDTGIGMTKDDLVKRIGTVASSGTLEFLSKAQEEKKEIDADFIGQFGVGFYSAFMVTDEISLETIYADEDSEGFVWTSSGEERFTIEKSDRTQRGTKITFTLKEEYEEFADPDRIKSILNKYSNFVEFPIFVNDEEINKVKPLWQRNKEDIKEEELNEFYKFVSNDFQDAMGHLHFSIEGNINFKALIFIPQTAPNTVFTDLMDKSLNLYSSKIFIQNDCKELLPDYMRFLRGVVDTEDLPLNVSREVTQSSPLITKMRNVITGKVISLLEDWAENDNDKFDKFYRTWGSLFKTGLNSDFSNKDRLVELVRYETSGLEKDKLKSLKDYVSTMPESQTEIYYVMGDSRELIERNPNLEYFKNKGIEVVYLYDPVDVFTFPYIQEYDGKKLVSIDKAEIKTEDTDEDLSEKIDEDTTKTIIERIKEVLGDKVEDVIESKRLVDSPATLVSGSQGMDPQMEKMLKYMDKDFQSQKKVFEVNTKHTLIKNLAEMNSKDSEDKLFDVVIMQLYEGAMILDGNLNSPAEFLNRMNELMLKATEN